MMCDTPVPCAITAVLQTQLGSTSYGFHKNVPCSLSGGTESAASQQQLEHQQCRTSTYAAQCKPAAHQGGFKPGQQVSCIYNRRLHPLQWFNCKSKSHGLDKIIQTLLSVFQHPAIFIFLLKPGIPALAAPCGRSCVALPHSPGVLWALQERCPVNGKAMQGSR